MCEEVQKFSRVPLVKFQNFKEVLEQKRLKATSQKQQSKGAKSLLHFAQQLPFRTPLCSNSTHSFPIITQETFHLFLPCVNEGREVCNTY